MKDMDKKKLQEELIYDEGAKAKVYNDPLGVPTIGVGRNLRDKGLSKDEILFLLSNDIDEIIVQLDNFLPWWKNLSDARQRVLANMAFNLGINGLLKFKNTLALIEAQKYEAAAEGMLHSLWARQVGNRAQRLARMMIEG